MGIWVTQFVPQDEALKLRLFDMHANFGVTLFALTVLRLLNRAGNPPAPLPDHVPGPVHFAARANHFLLYAILLVQPIIGFLNTNAWGFPVNYFGLFTIPSPIGKQPEDVAKAFTLAHWYGAVTLAALFTLHIAGVLYHGVIRRDGVVKRMLG